jgi:hypothetical protein
VNRKFGLSPEDIGNDALGLLFVSTTNAMPVLYWMFIFVFSVPSPIEEIRKRYYQLQREKDTKRQSTIPSLRIIVPYFALRTKRPFA